MVELGGLGDVPRVTTFTDTKESVSSALAPLSISTSGLGELFLLSASVNRFSRVLVEDLPLKSLDDKYDIDLSGMLLVPCRDDPAVRYLGV